MRMRRVLRRFAKLLLVLFSLALFTLGAHFIWAWLNSGEFYWRWLWLGVDWDVCSRLFFVFKLPSAIADVICWLTVKGVETTVQPLYLVVPVGVILLGIFLVRVARRIWS